jgi:hypothetical protein
MAGVEGATAPALHASTTATGLSALDDLFRTFRAATERGESISLSVVSKEGATFANFKIGNTANAGLPVAAKRPSKQLPAAADPALKPKPPAGRRKGPRGRGALLRDERRRQLKISADVFARSGRRGRCPPPAVHRPAIPTLALVTRQEQVVEQVETNNDAPRPLAAYVEMVGDAPGHQVLKLPPVPPPAPPVASFGPALRLRTRGRGGIQQLDGHNNDAMDCSFCGKLGPNVCFQKKRWSKGWREAGTDRNGVSTKLMWCPECYALDDEQIEYDT